MNVQNLPREGYSEKFRFLLFNNIVCSKNNLNTTESQGQMEVGLVEFSSSNFFVI